MKLKRLWCKRTFKGIKMSTVLAPAITPESYSGPYDLVNEFAMTDGFSVRKKTSSFAEPRAKSLFGNVDKNVISQGESSPAELVTQSARFERISIVRRNVVSIFRRSLSFHYFTSNTNLPQNQPSDHRQVRGSAERRRMDHYFRAGIVLQAMPKVEYSLSQQLSHPALEDRLLKRVIRHKRDLNDGIEGHRMKKLMQRCSQVRTGGGVYEPGI